MNADAYILGRLAEHAIQMGARHGGVDAMMLAAIVIRNRVSAGWQGGDWLAVLADAPTVAGNDYAADPYPVSLRSFTIKQFLQRVDGVYYGEELDIYSSGRALYYADLTEAASLRPWFVDEIARNGFDHERVGNVATLTLFS